jgi:chromosome segregation ATPase
LGIGLVVGLLIAFGYWLISPAFITPASETGGNTEDTGLLGFLGIDTGGPYMSTVSVQLVNPGYDYQPLYIMQQIAEYYAAKNNSLPFFEYLSKELDKLPMKYSYTVDELDAMIETNYDYNSEIPAIKLTITANTEEEAANLAVLVPQIFVDYLIDEEKDRRQQSYQSTAAELETVKNNLYEAQLELDTLLSDEIFNNPSYIALSARVEALQQELNSHVSELSVQYLDGSELQEEYDNTLKRMEDVTTELSKAESELQDIVDQSSGLDIEDVAYSMILEAKIRGLQDQLDTLIIGTETTTGLTDMIAAGTTSGPAYENLMLTIETVAEALAEAQKEYDDLMAHASQQDPTISLDYQIAQIKVDSLNAELQALQETLAPLYDQIMNLDEGNGQSDSEIAFDRISIALAEAKKDLEDLENQLGYDQASANTDILAAQDRVNTLTTRLAELNDELSTLSGYNIQSLENEYLVAGNPSIPTPVLPERSRARNTLLTGAIAGIIIAWIILNFRWLVNLVSPSGEQAKPEDEEEE